MPSCGTLKVKVSGGIPMWNGGLIPWLFQGGGFLSFRGVWPWFGVAFGWIGISPNLVVSSVVDTMSLSLAASFSRGNRLFIGSWEYVPNLLKMGRCLVSSTTSLCYARSSCPFFFLPFLAYSVWCWFELYTLTTRGLFAKMKHLERVHMRPCQAARTISSSIDFDWWERNMSVQSMGLSLQSAVTLMG